MAKKYKSKKHLKKSAKVKAKSKAQTKKYKKKKRVKFNKNSNLIMWIAKHSKKQCLKDKLEAQKDVLRQQEIILQARALLQAREKVFYEAERARNAALKKHMDALKEQENTIMNAEQMR